MKRETAIHWRGSFGVNLSGATFYLRVIFLRFPSGSGFPLGVPLKPQKGFPPKDRPTGGGVLGTRFSPGCYRSIPPLYSLGFGTH